VVRVSIRISVSLVLVIARRPLNYARPRASFSATFSVNLPQQEWLEHKQLCTPLSQGESAYILVELSDMPLSS